MIIDYHTIYYTNVIPDRVAIPTESPPLIRIQRIWTFEAIQIKPKQ
jgi:hypothetical protein